MVDVVHDLLGVHEPNEVLDDRHDVLIGQDADIGVDVQAELLIDPVASYLTEVVALIGEEEVGQHLTSICLIRRVSITQLTIDVVEGIVLRVAGVFL